MQSRLFLAVHELPFDVDDAAIHQALERISEVSHARGTKPIETFYTEDHRRGYTLFQAADPNQVRDVLDEAGLNALEVVPGDRVFTDLLDVLHY